jgi:hypothetical protein
MDARAREMGDELPLAECKLDVPGLLAQRDRYRRLSEALVAVDRAPGSLTVSFSSAVDAELMRETLAVERECCPFYRLSWDESERRLEVGVEDPRQDPALDAIAHALGAG